MREKGVLQLFADREILSKLLLYAFFATCGFTID
jgi:hypothetical protein